MKRCCLFEFAFQILYYTICRPDYVHPCRRYELVLIPKTFNTVYRPDYVHPFRRNGLVYKLVYVRTVLYVLLTWTDWKSTICSFCSISLTLSTSVSGCRIVTFTRTCFYGSITTRCTTFCIVCPPSPVAIHWKNTVSKTSKLYLCDNIFITV